MFLFANNIHVSSANSVVLKCDTFGKSLKRAGEIKLILVASHNWSAEFGIYTYLLYIVLAYVNNFQKVVVGALECHRNFPTSTAKQNGQQYQKLLKDQGELHK